ncbi:MAG: hypothetical protein FWF84_05825 [Kiritimatiellaeota bacterium]|nr:hypothetical protein [Kiritimatiellota bacterium]
MTSLIEHIPRGGRTSPCAANAVAQYAYKNSALGITTNETATISSPQPSTFPPSTFSISRTLDSRHRVSKLVIASGAKQPSLSYSYDTEGKPVV